MDNWQLIRKYYAARYRRAKCSNNFTDMFTAMRLLQRNTKRLTIAPITVNRLRVVA